MNKHGMAVTGHSKHSSVNFASGLTFCFLWSWISPFAMLIYLAAVMLRKAIFRPFANYLVPNTRCKYSNEEKQAPSSVLHCLPRSKSEVIISCALVVAASSPNVKDFAVDLMCSSFSHSECNNSCGPVVAGFVTQFSNL
jgi:hypothetical protein